MVNEYEPYGPRSQQTGRLKVRPGALPTATPVDRYLYENPELLDHLSRLKLGFPPATEGPFAKYMKRVQGYNQNREGTPPGRYDPYGPTSQESDPLSVPGPEGGMSQDMQFASDQEFEEWYQGFLSGGPSTLSLGDLSGLLGVGFASAEQVQNLAEYYFSNKPDPGYKNTANPAANAADAFVGGLVAKLNGQELGANQLSLWFRTGLMSEGEYRARFEQFLRNSGDYEAGAFGVGPGDLARYLDNQVAVQKDLMSGGTGIVDDTDGAVTDGAVTDGLPQEEINKMERPDLVFGRYLEAMPGYKGIMSGTPHLIDRLKGRLGDLQTQWEAFTPWVRTDPTKPGTEDTPGMFERGETFEGFLNRRGVGRGDPLKLSADLRGLEDILNMSFDERSLAQRQRTGGFERTGQPTTDLDFAHRAVIQPLLARMDPRFRGAFFTAANRLREKFERENVGQGLNPGKYLTYMRGQGMFN